jgi:conjugal transfer/entry exclusion protein
MTRRDPESENDEERMAAGLLVKAPHFVTAIIAVGGLIAAYFVTISEFKMKDVELQQKVVYLEQRVEHIENNITSIENKYEKYLHDKPSTSPNDSGILIEERETLKNELQNIRDVLNKTRQLLQQQQRR